MVKTKKGNESSFDSIGEREYPGKRQVVVTGNKKVEMATTSKTEIDKDGRVWAVTQLSYQGPDTKNRKARVGGKNSRQRNLKRIKKRKQATG